VILAVYIAFLGLLFLLPQYLHYVRDQSTLDSGLSLAPLGIGTLITAPFTARVVARFGARATLAGGLAAMSGSVALLLLLHRSTTVLLVLVSMALFGAMIPLTVTPATGVIMGDLAEEKAGDGGAINQLARQVGGALGVAIMGSVFAGVYAHRVVNQLVGFSHVARKRAAESIEQAQKVIAGATPADHAHLLGQIRHSFDVAARVSFAVAVALLLVAAVVAASLLADPATRTGKRSGSG
jgi:Na+/melibiose symporter-like transporter